MARQMASVLLLQHRLGQLAQQASASGWAPIVQRQLGLWPLLNQNVTGPAWLGLASDQYRLFAAPTAGSSRKEEQTNSKSVRVVLLQDVTRLGQKGEVRDASAGWVRHHLFPQGKVLYATPENVEAHAMSPQDRARLQSPEAQQRQALVKALKMLHRMHVNISRTAQRRRLKEGEAISDGSSSTIAAATNSQTQTAAAGSSGSEGSSGGELQEVMQGSVTPYDVRMGVMRQIGIELHESHLLMDSPITTFGTYKIPLNLRLEDDTQVELNVNVRKVTRIRHGAASI